MIEILDIEKNFDNHQVLQHVSLRVDDNEIVALLGPSGCGKTTLMKIAAGLEPPSRGRVFGENDNLSYIFQDDRLLPWRTVRENVCLVRDRQDEKELDRLLKMVGLADFQDYYPNQLSGGMKKRCGIARAFYKQSTLLLMDEPFSGLDYFLRQDMQQLLLGVWHQQKQSVLFITHEIEEALQVADRILLIGGTPSTIMEEFILPSHSQRRKDFTLLTEPRNQILKALSALQSNTCI